MIALASDHAGLPLKKEIASYLESLRFPWKDYGTLDEQRVDYPIYALKAAQAILDGECDRGLLFCGTGVGIGMAANKVPGIRCAICSDCYSARMSRSHNNANMLSMGALVVGTELAKMIISIWLETGYEGKWHQRRIEQLALLDQRQPL